MLGGITSFAQNQDTAADMAAKKLQRAGFEQKLGTQLPLDLTFTDESGASVPLSKYFVEGRPVILTLNYYNCPMLCTLILNGLVDALKDIPFVIGKDIEIVTVSFNEKDTPELAAQKKGNYLKTLARPGAEKGWHFLTGKKEQIDQLCSTVGFSYVYDEKSGEFGHASGIMVATPAGKLSHYFYGLQYLAKDVRLALVESSQNKIGSPVDKLLLFCFHYDPVAGKYTAGIMTMIRLGCSAAILALLAYLAFAFRREFRRPRRLEAT